MIKAYIISVIICFVVLIITEKAAAKRAKREGYRTKYKHSAWEKLHACLPVFIPLFNILMALAGIFAFERVYEAAIAKMEHCDKTPGGVE